MPQLQILNRSPGFGEQLGHQLGQGISEGISGRLTEFLQQKQNKSALEGLRPFMEQLEFTPEQMDQFVNSGVPAQIAAPLIGQIGKQYSAQKLQQQQQAVKESEENKKLGEEFEEWEGVFNTLEENLPYTGYPVGKAFFKNIPFSEAAEKNEAFDVAAFQLEKFARNAHTKGALSTKVYESLLSKLPSSKLTNSQNKGRMREWEKVILHNPKFKKFTSENSPIKKEAQPRSSQEQKEVTAVNPKTGQKLVLRNGKWQPLR